MSGVKLGRRKNCNLPSVKVDLPVLQERNINNLVKFGTPQGIDFIAASFVQSAADVQFIRKTLPSCKLRHGGAGGGLPAWAALDIVYEISVRHPAGR